MPYRHDAFISYSHAVDGRLAPLLEAGLEKLAKPVFKLRAMDVFRDQTSLSASPGLWTSIAAHLESSRWLVLLASPASAASAWCSKEALWWLEHRGVGSMLVVLTDGEIVWRTGAKDFDWAVTTALSSALKGRFTEEPLFVDLRWARQLDQPVANDPRLRAAVLDLADGQIVYRLRQGTLEASDAGSGAVRAAVKQPQTHSLAELLDGPTLALSPDGQWLAVRISPPPDYSGAIADGPRTRLAMYRARSLAPVALDLELFGGDRDAGPLMSFTPDGRWLLGSLGNAMTVIDVASAQRLDEAILLPTDGRPLGFAPGTGRLFVATAPGQAPLQADLRIEAWVARACLLAGRKLTTEEWRRYVSRDRPYGPACAVHNG